MTVLKIVLNKYHADELGEWTWVLVPTKDWQQILSIRGFNPDIPAFTYLPAKETFFEEALTARESIRGMQLRDIWKISIEELLDKAVRHELAHALCNEKDEFRARVLENRLRPGTTFACRPASHTDSGDSRTPPPAD
jgi:hypothetical protein